MNTRILASPLAVMAMAAAALAGAPARAQPALPTPAFIATAAGTDAFERRAGRLAERKAPDPQVKAFGARMVRDHTRTTAALKRAIHRARLPPPGPPKPSADQVMMLRDLAHAPRRDFDRQYIHDQVVVHQQALMAMQAYANGGDNPTLRMAAAQTVPIIQHHLSLAQKLEAKLH